MSAEAWWYASYDAKGNPPKCNRLIRMPYAEQLGVALDLALAMRTHDAQWMDRTISTTGERYWLWPDRPGRKYGDFWMLPPRTERLAQRAIDHAMARAEERRPRAPMAERPVVDMTEIILLRLRRAAYRAACRFAVAGVDAPPFERRGSREQKLAASVVVPPDPPALTEARQRRLEWIEYYGRRGRPILRQELGAV